ncbi:MAG: MFS transporter [Candidatus Anaerobiospirillum merdipullorum]|uniref:MFS transporter n=1 Tax=Candidatus Anaerobiospirillum merdipullorum TaxID=2838450 RepID=A0A9E2KMT1_9GAMM|nr:MFS transporter [Candidatus Anaerobiospirillum merdipullorum]
MQNKQNNWMFFFLVRLVGVLRHKVAMHPSSMTKFEFVYARLATRLSFFTAGIATSPWASIMPYVKDRLDLNSMHYASLVLCFGLGAVIGMPATGRLCARFGVKPILLLSALGSFCGMVGLSYEGINLVGAYACVLLWGMSIGVIDVANNIHGAYVEERAGRHLMSSFHAWYTVGCLASAVFCIFALRAGLHSLYLTLILFALAGALLTYYFPKLINTHGTGAGAEKESAPCLKSRGFIPAYLTLPVLVLGIICLIMYLTEGMIYDWSAVYLINRTGIDIAIASLGYLAFELAVAIMRFKGDSLVTKIGALRLIISGSVLSFACLLVIALSTNPYVMGVAFFLAGIGLANVVPVMLSETARISGVNQGKAIAFVGTLAYSGLLLGPGVLGAIATVFGLPGMFIFTAALIFLLGLMSFFVLRKID